MGRAKYKKPKPGDIIEVLLPDVRAYVFYVGKHASYGDTLYVVDARYSERVSDLTEISDEGGYYAFYPLSRSLREGLTWIIGHRDLRPDIRVPVRLRRETGRIVEGRVSAWMVEDGSHEQLRRQLTDEEQQLPIGSIWNHEMLVIRLTQKWRPEGDERTLPRPAPKVPETLGEKVDVSPRLRHYLYFPTQSNAKTVFNTLLSLEHEVDCQDEGTGDSWLVLVSSDKVSTNPEFDELQALLQQLADENGGEYDGWETRVQS